MQIAVKETLLAGLSHVIHDISLCISQYSQNYSLDLHAS